MNKTIYTTYHSRLPPIVLKRWHDLNPSYTIDFSLDIDCIKFLDNQFHRNIAELFIYIPRGMYKADLWRLCKLYIHGGVYADIDLVPFWSVSQITAAAPHATFYSCLSMSNNSIFQAIMVHSRARSPIILGFLVSFLYNKPYLNIDNGPTSDMYNFILYNVRATAAASGNEYIPDSLQPYTHYTLQQIRIPIYVSSIYDDIIPLHYFPEYFITYTISISPNTRNKWVLANRDNFKMKIENHCLIIDAKPEPDTKNADDTEGFIIDICIYLPECNPEIIYLFQESIRIPSNISTCYIKDKNGTNIMDCRDRNYIRDCGWTN